MRVEAEQPNIVRISFHQDPGDPNYGSCIWAYFDFDLDKYMLNVQSDCGNAAYRWVATPDSESFLHLMARINDDYLLYKLFDPKQVDVDATISEVQQWLEAYELLDDDHEEREEALVELEDILCGADSASEAAQFIDNWCDVYGFLMDCSYDFVMTDFSASQKRIVQIFADYVQPKIQEIVREAE